MSQEPRPRWAGITAFIIAIASFAAFIYLNRKMAPPYPRNPTNSVSGATNAAKSTAL